MSSKITRRDFLKLTGVTLGGVAFSPYLPPLEEFADGQLVRVGTTQVSVYNRPDDTSTITGQVFRDQVLNVYEEVNSGTPGYNPIWYRVWGGYVHRARMQKVQYIYNSVAPGIREIGQLAEVSVPYTQAMRLVGKEWQQLYRLYYTTVHWVKRVEAGPDGQPWYVVLDELLDMTYHVRANHLRLIPDEELTPISPEIPFEAKRIEVSLPTQQLTCYEYDKPIFTTLISSGRPDDTPGPNGIPTRTPAGKYNVSVKMPSKHMGGGSLAQAADIEAYQLPGVAWTTFFTPQGHAFHGTYWHDNFGVPMSSGCINMRTEEAKWLFRWTLPLAPADQIDPLKLDKKGFGTSIKITA
ncbi:MAG: L,D-transpeptidase family protein [Chloroflexi bacterium]|nr:L,D-transpeptidase family protein [Chloroflexota bacterium]